MTIAFGRRATLRGAAAATAIAAAGGASAQSPFRLGIVAFQMSSETHARAANAAEAEARKRGWQVILRMAANARSVASSAPPASAKTASPAASAPIASNSTTCRSSRAKCAR